MISECLQSLAEAIGKYKDEGLQLEPGGVGTIVGLLTSLANDAAALERTILAMPGCRDPRDWPKNVIPFPGLHWHSGGQDFGGDAPSFTGRTGGAA